MSQLEKVGLLVYTAIKSGMLSPGKEYDFDFTMSSWNQKLGRQSGSPDKSGGLSI